MPALPAEVLDSPLLVDFGDQIRRKLEAEEVARREFRKRAGDGSREEFINGEVIGHVLTQDQHMVCLGHLDQLITTFVRMRKLGIVRREQALTEFPRNDYCPDLCFWNHERLAEVDPKQTIYPPPDMIVEVLSPSTEARDRGVKFQDYEAHGVKEYWIVDPEKRSIEQYVEHGGAYHRVRTGSAGNVVSIMIPAFEIPVAAAFDDAAQLAALQAMVAAK